MRESFKSKNIWQPEGIEFAVLNGKGLDIGAGDAPIMPDARIFDLEHGDANEITKYVDDTFDYVYASHCLEHMHKPREAVQEWWKLVKPGGHLFFAVPDEDLYEQGVFPSRFNPDHKATFTLSKTKSWSPLSINVHDLALSLPQAEIISLTLQDHNYDRRLQTFGPRKHPGFLAKNFIRTYGGLKRRNIVEIPSLERFFVRYRAVDQTGNPYTLAQIQCIVRKAHE